MYACFHGHAGVVKAFLNEGADADLRNMAGRTALQLAQKAGFDDAARALLEGPNIMVRPSVKIVNLTLGLTIIFGPSNKALAASSKPAF